MTSILEIQCIDLVVGYSGMPILGKINFKVNRGDYLSIIGKNGSGKSTVMKTLLGLQEPIAGKIILGSNLTHYGLGYISQELKIQKDFPASVGEVVLSGRQRRCGLRPFYNKTDREVAKYSMEKMGIINLIKKPYSELSGGQQQRVLLARALCGQVEILFLDEPTKGLDPEATGDFYEIISQLNREEETTIIMVSHDINTSMEESSHILSLGKNIFFGPTNEYLRNIKTMGLEGDVVL